MRAFLVIFPLQVNVGYGYLTNRDRITQLFRLREQKGTNGHDFVTFSHYIMRRAQPLHRLHAGCMVVGSRRPSCLTTRLIW